MDIKIPEVGESIIEATIAIKTSTRVKPLSFCLGIDMVFFLQTRWQTTLELGLPPSKPLGSIWMVT